MAPPPSAASATTTTTAAIAVAATAVCASALFLSKQRKGSGGRSSAAAAGGDPSSDKLFEVPRVLSGEDCKYREEVKLAVKLALEAGANMIQHCDLKGTEHAQTESDLGISTKTNEADFCTAIDVLNEQLITDGIAAQYPTHRIIGEESVGTGTVPPLTDEHTWICDPIDGTTNFASGFPLTCVSIGLCVGGVPVMGVCYAPMTRELYVAVKGCGAYRNRMRIRSTTMDAEEKRLSKAVVCFEFGYARSEASIDKMLNGVRRILKHGCRTTRSAGSGVLDLCYVASGRFDVVYTGLAEEGWKPWDYCAAMVVVEEAGGTIRSLFGRPGAGGAEDVLDEFDVKGNVVEGSKFDIYSSSMVCGVNTTIVEECRRVVLGL